MKVPIRRVQKPAMSIPIQTGVIQLDAFLKLANAVESGGQAKAEIQAARVKLNGEPCTQRGKKLRPGDVVSFAGERYQVTAEKPEVSEQAEQSKNQD